MIDQLKLSDDNFGNLDSDSLVQKRKIFVGELPMQISAEDLKKTFSTRYGPVLDVTIRQPSNYIRQTRSDYTVFAFILFEQEISFQKALNDVDPPYFYGQRCIIKSALKRLSSPKIYFVPEETYQTSDNFDLKVLPPQRSPYPIQTPFETRKSAENCAPSFTFFGETPSRLPPIEMPSTNTYKGSISDSFDLPYFY